jgi:hypothetical protein
MGCFVLAHDAPWSIHPHERLLAGFDLAHGDNKVINALSLGFVDNDNWSQFLSAGFDGLIGYHRARVSSGEVLVNAECSNSRHANPSIEALSGDEGLTATSSRAF